MTDQESAGGFGPFLTRDSGHPHLHHVGRVRAFGRVELLPIDAAGALDAERDPKLVIAHPHHERALCE